ncbi:glycoside hydrolase family 3 N-terminal domain-containing protein [Arthrobacter sp. efr-133-TYG-118]|uniref:glycoside hydrolase family 3 protein n=1 Tax=Arthrobacter sp. efr-133-TYG-118 TaxID=3040279 RepID=UPI002549C6AC|nr:glycoside hydrolase family 3 N-terminal domain-containing protein [Arthrobacter sp. efr-133-TYG-118]
MSVADKVGLMFHPMGFLAPPDIQLPGLGIPPLRTMVECQRISHVNLVNSATTPRQIAEWHNEVQRIAEESAWGVPVTVSTDPRNSFTDNPAAALAAGDFSQWPEPLGLGAIGSTQTTQEFGDIVRREYLAVGIRLALHPQIDLATDARWARASGTFGADVELTSRLGAAYVRGLQGEVLGPDSVAAMIKHFPGGGPQKDGEDPHFPWGKEQIYPGGRFAEHLRPFEVALAAGASQVMPYYGIPIGTEHEEVGFGFNKSVITDLLRNVLGFDGIVCTDWSILSDQQLFGGLVGARAWGVEGLTVGDRIVKALDAGVDQFGGEHCTDELLALVSSGRVTEDRLDVSARRILHEKFTLGLFDDQRYVDVDAADAVVGANDLLRAGFEAQRAATTLLTNKTLAAGPVLPLDRGISIYAEGIDPSVAAEYAAVVDDPGQADVAILRLQTPFEHREGPIASHFRAGSLKFTPDKEAHVLDICRAVPTVLDVFLERPALLAPLVDDAAAIIANFGASDRALLDVLFGDAQPEGRLPFEIPSSTEAIEASQPDVASDTTDPLFPIGHGLSYVRSSVRS